MKNLKAFSIRIAVAAISCTVCLASASPAEKLRWEELQTRFGGMAVCRTDYRCDGVIEYRSIDVYTQDGRKHHTRRLAIASSGLRLYGHDNKMGSLARETVTRIKIRPTWSHFHNFQEVAEVAMLPMALGFDDDASGAGPFLALIITPPLLAGVAVSTPVFLVLDVISLFAPATTYEITP